MEKFSVDLEKVLDEFEYNEEHEERDTSPATSSQLLSHVEPCQVPLTRPPAANYRRPSFERINLSEADFASSPSKVTSMPISNDIVKSQNLNNDSYFLYHGKNKGKVSSNFNNNALNKTVEKHHEETWNRRGSSLSSVEEKPDLLEYKTNDIIIPPQLPDITTSLWPLPNGMSSSLDEPLKSVPFCDLISSSNGNFYDYSNKKMDSNTDYLQRLNDNNLLPGYANKNYPLSSSSFNTSLDVEPVMSEVITSKESVNEISGSLNTLHKEFRNVNLKTSNVLNDFTKDAIDNDNVPEISNTQSDNTLNNVIQNNTNHDRIKDTETLEDSRQELLENIQPVETVSVKQFKSDVKTVSIPKTKDNNYCPKIMGTSDVCSLNMNVKPMGFSNSVKLTDDELQQYLEDLEINQEGEMCLNVSDNNRTEENLNHINSKLKHADYINNEENVSQNTSDNKHEFLSPVENVFHQSQERQEENIKSSNYTSTEMSDSDGNKLISNVDCSNAYAQVTDKSKINNFNEKLESRRNITETNIKCLHNLMKVDTIEIQSNDITQKEKIQDSVENETRNNDIRSSVEIVTINEMNNENILVKCIDVEEHEKLIPTNDVKSVIENLSVIKSVDSGSCHEYLEIETTKVDDSNKTSFQQTTNKIHSEKENANASLINEAESVEQNEYTVETNDSLIENANNIDFDSNLDTPSVSSNSDYDSTFNTSAKMIPVKTAVECLDEDQNCVDETAVSVEEEEEKPSRPNSLDLPACITLSASDNTDVEESPDDRRLGKVAPIWVPDSEAPLCMQCQVRFNVIKRRHHCRACGQVLCSKCCNLKSRLEFCGDIEVRVCQPCFSVLESVNGPDPQSPLRRQPNPNNPMEYCSTIPPLQQVAGTLHQPPPSVMVPVGVLKREGRGKSDVTKQVIFSDGIRPGGDLTELDGSSENRLPNKRPGRQIKRVGTPPGGPTALNNRRPLDPVTQSFIPQDGDTALPPVITHNEGELVYSDCEQPVTLNEGLLKFAINSNLYILVKRVLLDCCVNRECWCYSTNGLSCVGQDEVVFLLQCLPEETLPPKDVFLLINYLYQNAAKGSTVSEMSFTPAPSTKLLGSRDHGGFLYIRPSYQCTAQLMLPPAPYLFALLIHRWEMPWARLFPIRLVLRLGAEFRYYPCPLVSVRFRAPLYTDIGHTIINLLADFRKYTYTLPTVRGLVIHMEDRQTSILIPRNRYDQIVRALNNSNDSVLAFGANFSLAADSHLVCMQSTEDESLAYHTQAINIHNKPRRVTGASFVVFNGALKTPGLSGKSNIVEDGLMVQVPSDTMMALRSALKDMHDYTIGCGPNAEETVILQWTADDVNFNVGVKSCIDGRPLNGVPSIRVHSGTDYSGSNKFIRWTEVFILQSEDDSDRTREPLDISRLSGSIAQATCIALVPLLDLLCAASLNTIAVRANIHPENVGYEAGGNGEKLPPFYMKSLDNELVAVVHQAALTAENTPVTLELVFRIMEQG